MTTQKNKPWRTKGTDLIVTPEIVEAVKSVRVWEKQKKAIEIVAENILKGRKTVQKDVLLKAGYSEAKANSPTQVFSGKAFREILETRLPKEKLAIAHDKLIFQGKLMQLDFPRDLDDEEIIQIIEGSGGTVKKIHPCTKAFVGPIKLAYVTFPTPEVILKALDLAYKVLGSYAPVKTESTTIDLVSLFNAAMKARMK